MAKRGKATARGSSWREEHGLKVKGSLCEMTMGKKPL